MSMKIVVYQRGFVAVGNDEREGPEVILRDAAIVRRWGTAGKGMGWLATNGPTPETVADKAGTIRAHELAIVMTLDVSPAAEKAWERRLSS